ncbi:spore coat protein [Thiospirochaeta perfilievii]|uniref:Spore coat protein n=1 Tax=Thiospirochaeta perfilievii TaxID=252967 RepID=A0A5C1QBN9_9SPIO|nr:N-acetylneuraminate synthase family protein [Thiospirochaeta perfilievii]QEN05483.1 spore coat protein [Thiospirochaeta perfilievii]
MPINKSKRTFIIAEIGTSHGGDLEKAKKLIRAAKDAGADCAKFQVVFAQEIIHKNTGLVKLPGGDTPLYSVFKSLEMDEPFYKQLKDMTESEGLIFMASPFGKKSGDILNNIGSKIFKVASPELNHFPLLKQLKSFNKPLILSSGVSKLRDIERALEITGRDRVSLLHCITSYPAPENEYNLKLISNLKNIFGIETGISDHSLDPVLVPSISVLLGASIVEKHLTLSNETDGLDDPVALNPQNFKQMCDSIRKYEDMDLKSGLDKLSKIYGLERVTSILGDGVKKLAKSEESNYNRTNRSLHSLEQLNRGDVITKENTALLRTEKILRVGLSPHLVENFYGRKLTKDVPSGEGIRLEDFL